jgi:hypothetical protein
MSNEKEVNNTSRRKRKVYNERLNLIMLMRPLRIKTKVLTDEYITENPNNYYLDQEIKVNNIIIYLLTFLFNKNNKYL